MQAGAPVFLTALIGRDDAIAEVAGLVAGRRVLTLLGAGGVGKTRLAVEAATRVDRQATFVDLAAVKDPAHVPAAFARGLGVTGRVTDESAVLAGLDGSSALLVVDNAEHVVDAVASLITRLMAKAPQVSVLATSRIPLGVDGELMWRVPPLDAHDAVQLFLDRARACAAEIGAGRDDLAHVEAICRHLDGIPLAVELVAARCRAFALPDLAAQVEAAVATIPDGRRGQPDRQRTMEDSVDWSWRLLDERARELLARLSVFPATFSLDAARVVGCADDETLLVLVDHSLVHVDDRTAETRYRLYEVVRECVRARGLEADAPDRLVDWCLERLTIPVSTDAAELDAVERDLATYRAAMQWCLDHDRAVDGLRIATALAQYWETRDTAEGMSWLEPLRDAVPGPCLERALAARAISHVVFFRGDFAKTRQMEQEAADYAREVGDDGLLGAATKGIAWAERALFERAAADRFVESVAPLRAAGDIGSLVDALAGVAETAWADGHVRKARVAAEEALAEARRGDPASLAQALVFVGFGACLAGDLSPAETALDEAVTVGNRLRDELWGPAAEIFLARVAALRGDPEGAVKRIVPLLERAEAAGMIIGLGCGWWARGLSAYEASEPGAAVPDVETGARVTLLTAFPYLSAELAATCARISVAAGDLDAAGLATDEAMATAEMPFGGYGRPPALVAAAELAEARGEYADGLRLAYEALDLAYGGGATLHVLDALDLIGRLRSETGDVDDGARLTAAANAERMRRGVAARLRDGAVDPGLTLYEAVALAQRGRGRRGRPRAGWESLTPTERDVVDLACEGLTNPEIAAKLFIAPATVKTHLSNVFSKLGVRNRAELATVASRRG